MMPQLRVNANYLGGVGLSLVGRAKEDLLMLTILQEAVENLVEIANTEGPTAFSLSMGSYLEVRDIYEEASLTLKKIGLALEVLEAHIGSI